MWKAPACDLLHAQATILNTICISLLGTLSSHRRFNTRVHRRKSLFAKTCRKMSASINLLNGRIFQLVEIRPAAYVHQEISIP